MHEDLISRHSELVNSILSKTSAETDQVSIDLKHLSALDMQFYVDWLYTKKPDLASQIGTYMEALGGTSSSKVHQTLRACNIMCNLWIAGDALKDAKFKNHVIDCLEREEVLETSIVPRNTIETIVKKTKSGSTLQRWLVDNLVGLSPAHLESLGPLLSESMVRELLKKYVEGADGSVAVKNEVDDQGDHVTSSCKYHDHAVGEKKCTIKHEQCGTIEIKDEE